MSENGKLTIARIEAESFLLIEKLEYNPRPGVNTFIGVNRAGKTDILRLIKAAFQNAGAEVIKHGKDKTTILVRLSDGHEIKRAITEKTKRFQVRTPEGDIKASPQAYLDTLLGDSDLSFDPISFVLKDPKSQKTMLLDTFNIGKIEPDFLKDIVDEDTLKLLDFEKEGLSVLKDAEILYYSRRSDINREVAQKKGHYEDLIKSLNGFSPESYNPEAANELSGEIGQLEQELSDARAAKRQAEGTNKLVESLQAKITNAEQELIDIDDEQIANIPTLEKQAVDIEQTIEMLHRKLADTKASIDTAKKAKARKEELQNAIRGHQDTIATLPKMSDIPNITEIEQKLALFQAEIDKQNDLKALFTIYQNAQSIYAEYQDKAKESEVLTEKIDILRKDLPGQLTANIDLPFESLSFDGDEVLINGNRLSLMATSEQLFATLQIYKERNKNAKLKILCADRIESLDDESYQLFWKFCMDNGFQAFVTKVLSAPNPEDAVMVKGGQIQ